MSDFMIGQRVIYQNVICTVCQPDVKNSSFNLWIANPEKRYSHGVAEHNLKPLPHGQL
tara:strand:- start:884 stop:1057 length:174 start_codon:yes stop_codon:yes gene_type:complete